MTQRPDLNKLAKEVYQANKEKGFHDTEQSNETLLMLVITELSEAVEADRKGQRADLATFISSIRSKAFVEAEDHLWKDLYMKNLFEQKIKDSVEDELADAVIRLLDLAGLREVSIAKEGAFVEKIAELHNLPEFTFWVIGYMYSILYQGDLRYKIQRLIDQIECYCEINQIDLWQHVELKLKYNQTRPMKHGKLY